MFVNSRAIIERDRNRKLEIVVQTRNKPGEPKRMELPGGRIETFESLYAALRREVREETGLTITYIEGEESRMDTVGMNPEFEVECLKPFAAYQTIKGSFDSVGYYFRCKADGELLESGDDTIGVRWISVSELTLTEMMKENPLHFTNVDRAGVLYYLKFLGLM